MRPKIGIIGGGQLACLLHQASVGYDCEIHYLCRPGDPITRVAPNVYFGDYRDAQVVADFAAQCQRISYELEEVEVAGLPSNVAGLSYPEVSTFASLQDKWRQKILLGDFSVARADAYKVSSEVLDSLNEQDFPLVNKRYRGGYDGKGVQRINSPADFSRLYADSYLEVEVSIMKELSVVVARNNTGQVVLSPVIESEFDPQGHLIRTSLAPAIISRAMSIRAHRVAKKIVQALEYVGVLTVEFFLTRDGALLVNELAPRVHNSGHLLSLSPHTSQFDLWLRCLLDLPLVKYNLAQPVGLINLFARQPLVAASDLFERAEVTAEPNCSLFWYGKDKITPYRKLGHLLVTGNLTHANPEVSLRKKMRRLEGLLRR